MKTQMVLKAVFLVTLCAFIAGCATTGSSGARTRHFREGSKANVVLQFSSWDYTFMIQPRYEDEGFLRPVARQQLDQVLERLKVNRDLAVVVIGWTYGERELAPLVTEWKAVLAECQFRRVVFLRSNPYNQLNGSVVIDDAILPFAAVQARAAYPTQAH